MAEATCAECDEVVSGPDAASVKETIERHAKKHGAPKVTRNPRAKK